MTKLCRGCCLCLFDLSICYDNHEAICLVLGAWQALIGQFPSPWPGLYLQKMAALADLLILTSAGSLPYALWSKQLMSLSLSFSRFKKNNMPAFKHLLLQWTSRSKLKSSLYVVCCVNYMVFKWSYKKLDFMIKMFRIKIYSMALYIFHEWYVYVD